ncbi:nucleotidyl transferase AbiEii/AbiGii toxin family protein [Thermodesulfovibrio hydrogeniphilus]
MLAGHIKDYLTYVKLSPFIPKPTKKSRRFTKDIDLCVDPSIPVHQIQQQVKGFIKSALKDNPVAEKTVITEPKQTETTLKWKICGTIAGTPNEKVELTVEVFRHSIPPRDFITAVTFIPPIEYNLSPILVESYSLEALMLSKMLSLLSDTRQAIRDVYDVFLLVNIGVDVNKQIIASYLKQNNISKDDALKKIWQKMSSFTYERAINELLPFLPKAEYIRLDETFYAQMRATVIEHLQGTIEDCYKGILSDSSFSPVSIIL